MKIYVMLILVVIVSICSSLVYCDGLIGVKG